MLAQMPKKMSVLCSFSIALLAYPFSGKMLDQLDLACLVFGKKCKYKVNYFDK